MRLRLLVALFVLTVLASATGGAVAGGLVTGAQIKNQTITGKDVKKHSLSTKQLSAKAVAQLTGTPGLPGAGARQFSYRHSLNYPTETLHKTDAFKLGPITYVSRCHYTEDDLFAEVAVRSTAADSTVGSQFVFGGGGDTASGPFARMRTVGGTDVVVGYAGVFEVGDDTKYGSGTANVAYPGGFQQLSFSVAVLPDNTCQVHGAVLAAK